MNELSVAFTQYPYMMTDWLFVAFAALFAIMPHKGCAYRHSNMLVAGQILTAIGFSTAFIALQIKFGSDIFYDGAMFYGPLFVVYSIFYYLIGKTGDRFQAILSLIAGGYHFAIFAGITINFKLNEYLAVEYEHVMVLITVLQLLLAFRGGLYGVKYRIDNADCWREHNRHHNL